MLYGSYRTKLPTSLMSQGNNKISVKEILKGGSLGQGTAVPGEFDLDLILYSQGESKGSLSQAHDDKAMTLYIYSPAINPYTVAMEGVGDILDILEEILEEKFGDSCTNLSMTEYSVSFTFHGVVEVDLLPSPFWEKKEELHAFLSHLNNEERRK